MKIQNHQPEKNEGGGWGMGLALMSQANEFWKTDLGKLDTVFEIILLICEHVLSGQGGSELIRSDGTK